MVANIAGGSRDLFASHREVAWHGLGIVFQETVTDYREMLELSGLNYSVEKVETPTPDGYRRIVPSYDILANVAGENVILGTTGERYEIVQNADAFSFLQSLSDGASWETAGAIKGGRVVFGSIEFERETVLDPTGVADRIKYYLMVTNAHDGSGTVQGGRTPVRVVCENTLNVALPGLSNTFKFRHTMKVADRMAKGAEEWRKNNVYFDAFETEAQALFAKPVTDKQYFETVGTLFPKPESDVKGAVKKWESRQELFSQAWKGTPNAGIKGTAWGALNALTEANQWGRNVQSGRENGQENFAAAGAGFDVQTNTFRQNALALVKAL